MLGGSRYLLPAIKAAHDLGIYVITADYLPDNYAHKFSDEYVNISIIDREAVLSVAQEKRIDGIMSYATDPGVVTAAYVAEKMGLPQTGSYKSVSILQDKGRFRQFLRENNFNVPWFMVIDGNSDAFTYDNIKLPCIVKPVDSAGSKGVSRVDNKGDLDKAIADALRNSRDNRAIVEEYIEPAGHSTDSDSFSVNGKLVFFSLNDQWFDENASNPYTPAGFSWPSRMSEWAQDELRAEVQRLLNLLDMKTGIYNIETRLGTDGKTYIMECSPRAGGNRLAEVLRLCTGQDIITASVKAAMGMEIEEITSPVYRDNWSEIILHGNHSGFFDELYVDQGIKDNIVERDLWIERNEKVAEFTGANKSIGTLILRFDDKNRGEYVMRNAGNLVSIRTSTEWGGLAK